MKCFLLVLIFLLALFVTSCTDSKTNSEPSIEINGGISAEPDDSNAVDSETGDVSSPSPGDPSRTYSIHLSKTFKALCRDAYEAVDRYLAGAVSATETRERLFEIIEKMVEEHNKMPEGDSASAAAGAIMMTMSLHDYVYKDSPEDKEMFRMWRDVLEKFADA